MDQTSQEHSGPGHLQNTIKEQSHLIAELKEKCHDLEGLARSLHREKHILEDMLNNTDVQIVFLDKSFHFVKVNPAYTASAGYSPEELTGKNHFDLFPNDENEALFEQARTTGKPVRFQSKPVVYPDHPERGITYWDWTLTPIKDATGEIEGFVLSLMDVTEQRRATDALTESEAKYSALVEQDRDGVFVAHYGVIRFANRAMAKIFAMDIRSLTGRQFTDLLAPEDRAAFLKFQETRLNRDKESPDIFQARTQGADGSEKYLEISAEVIKYEGRPAVMGIVRDITRRIELQEELATASRLESIGVLAGDIAHDFNNLLTGVLGYISLGKIYLSPEDKVHNLLSQAESAALHAREVVGELVTLARNSTPVQKAYSVRKLLEESACLSLSGTRVECNLSIPEDVWPVDVDAAEIKHALNNILFNAEDAMPQGGTIELSAQNCILSAQNAGELPLNPGNYVMITIGDQGTGIPEKYLSRIFDPYFSTKERGAQKGMGMGLATAYSIVKHHDGHISVESRLQVGTIFRIYLPASASHT